MGDADMQIPSLPPPLMGNTLPQDIVAKAVPNLQAAPPLLQRAINPAPKSEKNNQSRNNKDRRNGGGREEKEPGAENKGGHSVNIKV
jgi:hypothetical protein